MQDLQLWRTLLSRRFVPAQVIPALRALAGGTLADKRPFLGLILPLAGHTDPAVRAAAVAALGKARGIPALRQLVIALQDPEPAVRTEAVEALRDSLDGYDGHRCGARHVPPRPGRPGGRDARRPRLPAAGLVELLPARRPRHGRPRPDARGRVVAAGRRPAGAVRPGRVWDAHAAEARAFACKVPWPDAYQYLGRWGERPPEASWKVIEALSAPDGRAAVPAVAGHDAIDDLFALLADGDEPHVGQWFKDALDGSLNFTRDNQAWAAAAAVVGMFAPNPACREAKPSAPLRVAA